MILSLFCFAGCDPIFHGIDAEKTLATTVKIELVDYKNENPKFLKLKKKEKPKFDFSKATLIATLDDSQFENIINDMSKITLLMFSRALNEPIGKTIILYQQNGDMIVFYSTVDTDSKDYYDGCTKFDKNGVFIEYLGDIDSYNLFTSLLSTYFNQ
jgi:hypothetical protein